MRTWVDPQIPFFAYPHQMICLCLSIFLGEDDLAGTLT